MKKCPSWLKKLLFGGSLFKPRKKLRKMTKTGPKRDPQAIEPDLAGERKAQWNLMSQRCYLLLSLESGVTMWLSDVISCHQLLPITRYCLQLHAISCYAWLLLFAAIRCYMLLFAGICCYLLLFVAGCCNLLLSVAGCCCLLFLYCCLLLLAEDSC